MAKDPARRASYDPLPEDVLGLWPAVWLFALTSLSFGVLAIALALGAPAVKAVDGHVVQWGYDATEGFGGRTTWWLDVAKYGAPIVLRGILVLVAVAFAWRRRWMIAGWLVATVVAENVLAPGAKLLLNRPRPHWLHPIAVEHSLSFPSGHAAGAGMFITAGLLATSLGVAARPLRLAVAGLITAVALIICADRVFLGVHYLSDVLGGVFLGVAIASACWIGLLALRVRRGS